MSKELKKTLEIMLYLMIEVGLAYATVYYIKVNPVLVAPISSVYAFVGKLLVKKIKE